MGDEKMRPVAAYTATNTHWQSNLYDVFYVACRCGFAYAAAHEQLDEHDGDRDIKISFHTQAFRILINVSKHIQSKMKDEGGYSQSLKNEMDSIASYYAAIAPQSYSGNNQFNGIMGKDIATCKHYETFFEGLVKEAV